MVKCQKVCDGMAFFFFYFPFEESDIPPNAMKLIHRSLSPMIQRGRKIDRMRLVVCPSSQIAELSSIRTLYGDLKVQADFHVEVGVSYIIEEIGKDSGFAWVTRNGDWIKGKYVLLKDFKQ